MAHVPISLVGGGGADLDLITVTPADVRKNKVYVDADGNAQNGAMPELPGTITPERIHQTSQLEEVSYGEHSRHGNSPYRGKYLSGKNVTVNVRPESNGTFEAGR